MTGLRHGQPRLRLRELAPQTLKQALRRDAVDPVTAARSPVSMPSGRPGRREAISGKFDFRTATRSRSAQLVEEASEVKFFSPQAAPTPESSRTCSQA
jgi:hypothetical protein